MSEADYEMDWSIRFSVSCTARQAISFNAVFLQVKDAEQSVHEKVHPRILPLPVRI